MRKITINFQIPDSWSELSDKQLRKVYELIATGMDADEIKILCLLRWTDTKVIGRQDNGSYLLKKGSDYFEVTPAMLGEMLPQIDWLEQVSPYPVRLAQLNRKNAVEADFQGVDFETFIVCDNYFQGYLQTQNEQLLNDMGNAMYRTEGKKFNDWSRISIFYWFASLKEYFSKEFPNFFQPAGATADGGNLLGGPQRVGANMVRESMNAMIRALTKGDITKEAQILAMDTWRALTELDAQAREYKQLNEQMKNGKQS